MKQLDANKQDYLSLIEKVKVIDAEAAKYLEEGAIKLENFRHDGKLILYFT